jgi:FMN phosphatase YigB (HAD superfamily)
VSVLDPRRFRALSFDCYGTLIDWEAGILDALRPLRAASNRRVTDDEILEVYARSESRHEAGICRRYRDILRSVLGDVAALLSVPERRFDADARPDLEVPDLTTLARMTESGG